MIEKEPHMSNELLAKYFAGELTVEQAETVDLWAKRSAANREQLDMLQIIWLDTGAVETYETPAGNFDSDLAWRKVKATKDKATGGGRQNWWALRIAASLVILLGLAYLLKIIVDESGQVEFATGEEVQMLQLADGSRVTVNKGSTLEYPREFNKRIRAVSLKGEAFFEVEHNPERPFVVHAAATTIEVLGTSFNVAVDGGSVEVTVETGKVRFSAAGAELILTEGQGGYFSPGDESMRLSEKERVPGGTQYWRTRRLAFSGNSLAEVVVALENAFGVQIELGNEALANCSLTVTFENDTLENMLDVIALTLDLKVTKQGDTIFLSGIGCPAK